MNGQDFEGTRQQIHKYNPNNGYLRDHKACSHIHGIGHKWNSF